MKSNSVGISGSVDAGTALRQSEMAKRWTGSDPELDQGLAELEAKNIIQRVLESTDEDGGEVVYRLTDPHSWRG